METYDLIFGYSIFSIYAQSYLFLENYFSLFDDDGDDDNEPIFYSGKNILGH